MSEKTRDIARPLDEFEGDPLGSETEYLRENDFADAVLKLEPAWTSMRSALVSTLRAFDERGVLRPALRIELPREYAVYDAQRSHFDVFTAVSEAEIESFETIRDLLTYRRRHFEDPVRRHPLETLPGLDVYRRAGTDAPNVAKWEVHVGDLVETENRRAVQITRDALVSYYAPWQVLRAWTLLEKYTFRALLDPRATAPEEMFGSKWDRSLRDKMISWTTGHPRPDRQVEELAEHGWLTALYRSRSIIDWAELRAARPDFAFWTAGEKLPAQLRWDHERERIRRHCRTLLRASVHASGARWDPDAAPYSIPEPFLERMRSMLDLWQWATEQDHATFRDAIHKDLLAATQWVQFALDVSFDVVAKQVGARNNHERTSLALVLTPDRERACRTMMQHLPYVITQFNRHVRTPQLLETDGEEFIAFLLQEELTAWIVEAAAYFTVDDRASDSNRDQRFLHLRSLGLLCEPIVVALAERFGTDADRRKMTQGTVKDPLKAFLSDRRDWRGRLWQHVETNYALTTTGRAPALGDPPRTPAEQLIERFNAIQALEMPADVDGAAKQLLSLAVMRNFGAHRFSRDGALLHDYGGIMTGAALFSAMFYWKVATTLR